MAATDLERLVVSLSADIKSFERSMAKAQGVTTSALRKINSDATKEMGRFEKTFGRAGSALAGFGKGLVIGGIAAAVAGIEELIRGSIQSAAAIGDLSDKLGITSDKLQEIQYGAVQANLGFEEMEGGLLKFSKALGQAQNGSGDLFKILSANGFTKAQIKALDYGQALDILAELTKNAKNEQDGLLVTTAGFGKGVADKFLEFLRDGKSGLDGFGKAAHDANAIVDAELIKSAQKFDDAWAAALVSVKAGITDFVLHALTELSKLPQSDPSNPTFGGRGGRRTGPQPVVAPPPGSTPTQTIGKPPNNFGGSGGFLKPTQTVIPDPEAEAARLKRLEDAKKAYEDQQKAIKGVVEALQFEIEQGKASELQQQINLELRKAGTTATEAQKKQIIDLTTARFNMARAEQESIDAGEKFLEQQAELKEVIDDFGQKSLDAFESIISGGEDAADVLKKLAIEFIKTAIQAKALGATAGSGGGAGFLGNLFDSLFGGGTPKLYAKGGQIPSGQMGIAGEAGPELIQGPANVIPFNKLRGGRELKVIINDQRTNAPAVKQQRDGSGNLMVTIMDAVDKRIEGRYGARPQQVRR